MKERQRTKRELIEDLSELSRRIIQLERSEANRSKIEKALKESEEGYRDLVEKAGIGILIDDRDGNVKYTNKKYAELFGYTEQEMKRLSIRSVVHPDDVERVMEFHRMRIQEKKAPSRYEFRGIKKDGSVIYLEVDAVELREGENIIGSRSYVWDITERKKAEEKIEASLREKEILLREVHHRVKNNMQIISSLFSLQARRIEDKEAAEIFRNCQNRVRSMTLVHDRLYQSADLAKVDVASYVENLISHLFGSYVIDPKDIRLNLDIKDVFLDIDKAIPCGLIINELVTNSLKHAFPQGRKGRVLVTLRHLDGNEVELTVSDDGIGLPEDLDLKNTESLGLHLVTILAESQLHGTIHLDRTGGTTLRVRFKSQR